MHSSAPALHRHSSAGKAPVNEAKEAKGLILNGGWRYDLHGWFIDTCWFRGQGRVLRRRAPTMARLLPGEPGLDWGCGAGTRALCGAGPGGRTGRVPRVDPRAEQT